MPGLLAREGEVDGSALVQFDFKLPGTVADLPPQNNAVHEGVRRDAESREQVNRFLMPGGKVEAVCGGVCNGG